MKRLREILLISNGQELAPDERRRHPPNPNATITNFNSGVVVQANLDEPQAVELTPNLQGKKKVKKIKKAKKKETYLSLDDDS